MTDEGLKKEKFSHIIAISPDGRKIINYSYKDKFIEVWDIETETCLDTINLKIGTGGIYRNTGRCACFSKDGARIIYNYKRSIIIKEYSTDNEPKVLLGHGNVINSIALSPNGELIASGSDDGTIKIWNLESCDCIHSFDSEITDYYTKGFETVIFSPESEFIIGVTQKGRNIRIWNLKNKELVHGLNPYNPISKDQIFLFPEENLLLISMDDLIELWNYRTGKKIRTIGLFSVKCLISTLEVGNLLLGAKRSDPTIWIFNLDKNQLIGKFSYDFKSLLSPSDVDTIIHISNSYNLIVTYFRSGYPTKEVILWNFKKYLDNPIQEEPFPVKEKQYFTQSLSYDSDKGKELILQNMNIDSLDQIEGLGNLTDLFNLSIGRNNIHKSIIIALGGLDPEDNAIYPERFVEYARSPYEIPLTKYDEQRSEIWLRLKGTIIWYEIERVIDLIEKGYKGDTKNIPLGLRPDIKTDAKDYKWKIHQFEDFIGCTEEELEDFEKKHNIKLPLLYRQFLQEFGKTKDYLFDVVEYNFEIVYVRTDYLMIARLEDAAFLLDLNETDLDPMVYVSTIDKPEYTETAKLSDFFFNLLIK